MAIFKPVPQLNWEPNISPSYKLSVFNLYHYAVLLSWIFWRPDYVIAYAEVMNSRQKQDRFVILSFLLTSFSILAIASLYFVVMLMIHDNLHNQTSLFFEFILGLAGGIAVCLILYFAIFINYFTTSRIDNGHVLASRVTVFVILGIIFGLIATVLILDPYMEQSLFRIVFLGVMLGSAAGLSLSTVSFIIPINISSSHIKKLLLFYLFSISILIVWGIFFSTYLKMILFGLMGATISFAITVMRLDEWLFSFLTNKGFITHSELTSIPRLTIIPIRGLALTLESELEQDWEVGLSIAKQIKDYTRQDWVADQAIREILYQDSNKKNAEIVSKIEKLQQTFPNMDLLDLMNRSSNKRILDNISSFFNIPLTPNSKKKPKSSREKIPRDELRRKLRQKQRKLDEYREKIDDNITYNSPLEASAAGFFYLHKHYPERAKVAFSKVIFSDFGREMAAISEGLETLWLDEHLVGKHSINLPKKPKDAKHETTWNAFSKFPSIVRFAWLIQRTRSPDAFEYCRLMLQDGVNQVFGEIPNYIEHDIFRYIILNWYDSIQSLIASMQPVFRPKKISEVENPFVFTEPLNQQTKNLLTGRKTEIEKIYSAWAINNFQPLLICGQRQVGKTSLLMKADAEAGSRIRLAYVNFRQLDVEPSQAKLLTTIIDVVSSLGIYTTSFSAEISADDLHRVFRQYIQTCCSLLGNVGLVIALDEMEYLEDDTDRPKGSTTSLGFSPPDSLTKSRELLKERQLLRNCIQFLWSLSQSIPNLSLVFVTSSQPASVDSLYNTLLTKYVQPIRLQPLTKKEATSFLRSPSPDFLLYFQHPVIPSIFRLTAGQPYLIQLFAYYIVEHYNSQVRDKIALRDPLIKMSDVDVVRLNTDFQRQCERYYRSILEETKFIDVNSESLLKELSQSKRGKLASEIISIGNPNELLSKLQEHSIVNFNSSNKRWRITVELFRLWLQTRP